MTAQAIPFRERKAVRNAESLSQQAGPRILPLFFFVVAVVALFFTMIYMRISLDEVAFELDRLTDEIAAEESIQLDLRFDFAELQDPLRIATEAQRIGLVHPDQRVAVVVEGLGLGRPLPLEEMPVRALDGGSP